MVTPKMTKLQLLRQSPRHLVLSQEQSPFCDYLCHYCFGQWVEGGLGECLICRGLSQQQLVRRSKP